MKYRGLIQGDRLIGLEVNANSFGHAEQILSKVLMFDEVIVCICVQEEESDGTYSRGNCDRGRHVNDQYTVTGG